MNSLLRTFATSIVLATVSALTGCSLVPFSDTLFDSRSEKVKETETKILLFGIPDMTLPSGGEYVDGNRHVAAGEPAYEDVLLQYDDLTPDALITWVGDQSSLGTSAEKRLTQDASGTTSFYGHEVANGEFNCFAGERRKNSLDSPDTIQVVAFENDNGDAMLYVHRNADGYGCADEEFYEILVRQEARAKLFKFFADSAIKMVLNPITCSAVLGGITMAPEVAVELCTAN